MLKWATSCIAETQRIDIGDITVTNSVDSRLLTSSMDRSFTVKKLIPVLQRKALLDKDNLIFLKKTNHECNRNYYYVHSGQGELEVIPVKALHVPGEKNLVHVKIEYGDEEGRSTSLPPGPDLTFYSGIESAYVHPIEDESGFNVVSEDHNARPSASPPENEGGKTVRIRLDLLNIKGSLKVKVISERFPKYKEVAFLDIPIFNLLDNICMLDSEVTGYTRWFTLLKSSDSELGEGHGFDSKLNAKLVSEEKDFKINATEDDPCILLQFRWKPETSPPDNSMFYARLQLPDLSISIVDSTHARELLQLSVCDVTVRKSETRDFTDTSVNIGILQIDNQLNLPVAPVIFHPTQIKYPQPVIRFHLKRSNLNSQSHLNSFEAIQVIVQELDLKLEQQTVVATWELVQDWMAELRQSMQLWGDLDSSKPLSIDSVIDTTVRNKILQKWFGLSYIPEKRVGVSSSSEISTATSKIMKDLEDDSHNVDKIYIEKFQLGPIKINVSFLMTPHMDTSMTGSDGSVVGSHKSDVMQQKDNINNESDKGLMDALWQFFWQVGEVVLALTSGVDNAPIMLNGLYVPNLFETEVKLGNILQGHYFTSALRQLYKIVGSLELVGNPIGLMSSLGVGVKDFFYEPAFALITTPTEFGKIGKSVVKGTLSLMTNTADGMIGTGTTITRNAGRGIAKLSMDNAFIIARQELQRMPRDPLNFVMRPLKDIRNGVYYGVMGVFRVPYFDVKRYGISGVIPGVAKGVIGVFTKPVVGLLDAVTHVGEGFREGIKYALRESSIPVTRRRLSNMFGPDGRILPFYAYTALGTYILNVIDQTDRENFNRVVTTSVTEGFGLVRSGLSMVPIVSRAFTKRSSAPASANNATNSTTTDTPMRRGSRGGRIQSLSRKGSALIDFNEVNLPNSSEFSSEFVIFTVELRKAATANLGPLGRGITHVTNQVIIITTSRVVVADYKRDSGGAIVKLVWQCELGHLFTPILERVGGGASVKLRSRVEKNGLVRSVVSGKRKSLIGLESDLTRDGVNSDHYTVNTNTYQEIYLLEQLHNCLVVMIGKFDDLIPLGLEQNLEGPGGELRYSDLEGETCYGNGLAFGDLEEDENGVVRIGPWEYTKLNVDSEEESKSSAELTNNPALRAALETWKWVVPTRTNDDGVAGVDGNATVHSIKKGNNWLHNQCVELEEAHMYVEELNKICTEGENESGTKTFIQLLKGGNATRAEFMQYYESEKLKRSLLHAEDTEMIKGEAAVGDDSSVTQASKMGIRGALAPIYHNIRQGAAGIFTNLTTQKDRKDKTEGKHSKGKKKKSTVDVPLGESGQDHPTGTVDVDSRPRQNSLVSVPERMTMQSNIPNSLEIQESLTTIGGNSLLSMGSSLGTLGGSSMRIPEDGKIDEDGEKNQPNGLSPATLTHTTSGAPTNLAQFFGGILKTRGAIPVVTKVSTTELDLDDNRKSKGVSSGQASQETSHSSILSLGITPPSVSFMSGISNSRPFRSLSLDDGSTRSHNPPYSVQSSQELPGLIPMSSSLSVHSNPENIHASPYLIPSSTPIHAVPSEDTLNSMPSYGNNSHPSYSNSTSAIGNVNTAIQGNGINIDTNTTSSMTNNMLTNGAAVAAKTANMNAIKYSGMFVYVVN